MIDIYGTESLFLPVSWLTALAGSELRVVVYGYRELYGVVRFLHLACMAGFYGPLLLISLRNLGIVSGEAFAPARRLLARVMNLSFALVVLTGVLLFLRDPIGMGLHTMFLPKLILTLLGFILARALRAMRSGGVPRRGGAVLLFTVWTAVIGASVWNHVERPVNIPALLRATTAAPR